MINEHNPIAQLVGRIQNKWIDEVSQDPEIKLVRWLIKPSQADLYAGFLKLESTTHGKIPEVPVVLLSHFKDYNIHSKTLIKDWLEAYEKDEAFQDALNKNNLTFNWDTEKYKKKLSDKNTNYNLLLLEMLAAFQKALPNPELPMVLSLYPYSISDTDDYQAWIETMMQTGFTDRVRLMIFDFVEDAKFDKMMKQYPKISKSLSVPLDVEGAINKLAESGNQNDPTVQFRKCMVNMSKCAGQKKLDGLHKWGERGLAIMRKTGIKSNYATAYIIYASMLLNFKKHEQIETLSKKALNIATKGFELGDKVCQSLIIQSYGLLASNYQMQKKLKKAGQLYNTQAEKCVEFGMEMQALTAWWLAYTAIRKIDRDESEDIIKKAYELCIGIEKESLKVSPIRYLALDYYKMAEDDNDEALCTSINDFMTELNGENWREDVQHHQKNMKKRKLSIANIF